MFKERFHFREKISRTLTWDFPHFEIIYTKAQISVLLSQILWLSIYIKSTQYLKFSQWQEQSRKVAVSMDLPRVAFAHCILPKLHKSLETPEKAGMYHTKYFYICTLQHWKKTPYFLVLLSLLLRLKPQSRFWLDSKSNHLLGNILCFCAALLICGATITQKTMYFLYLCTQYPKLHQLSLNENVTVISLTEKSMNENP